MPKAWLLRPNPHNINRMREFLTDEIIAIGWPEINSLCGENLDDIKTLLMEQSIRPYNYSPDQLGAAAATINRFVNEFRDGDLIVAPDKNNIYFCQIKSNYYYDESKVNDGYPHQRKVKWTSEPVRRDDIPDELRQSLRAPRMLADLSHHYTLINNFLNDNEVVAVDHLQDMQNNEDTVEFTYPIRLDKVAVVRVPKDITQIEASRLADFVKTLYF